MKQTRTLVGRPWRSAHTTGVFQASGKGTIAPGSDADIALWDPGHRRTINGARMQSRSGYSVYDGWQVQGWPRFVVRRGQLVLADGRITARPGDGRWLRRNTTAGVLPYRPRRRF